MDKANLAYASDSALEDSSFKKELTLTFGEQAVMMVWLRLNGDESPRLWAVHGGPDLVLKLGPFSFIEGDSPDSAHLKEQVTSAATNFGRLDAKAWSSWTYSADGRLRPMWEARFYRDPGIKNFSHVGEDLTEAGTSRVTWFLLPMAEKFLDSKDSKFFVAGRQGGAEILMRASHKVSPLGGSGGDIWYSFYDGTAPCPIVRSLSAGAVLDEGTKPGNERLGSVREQRLLRSTALGKKNYPQCVAEIEHNFYSGAEDRSQLRLTYNEDIGAGSWSDLFWFAQATKAKK
jgi:hypothetical protein